jgi:hypothetical protein
MLSSKANPVVLLGSTPIYDNTWADLRQVRREKGQDNFRILALHIQSAYSALLQGRKPRSSDSAPV